MVVTLHAENTLFIFIHMNNNTKKDVTPDSIKSELNTLLNLNRKRKSALEKLSKSILENSNKKMKNKTQEGIKKF